MTIHIQQKLQELLNVPSLPCEDASDWAQGKTIQEIWNTCDRGDWLLWWVQKRGLDSRKLTAAKAACAEFARPYMKDARSIAALDMAHAYGRGECSADDLAAAAAYAAATAAATAATAATAAATSAAYAADAAYAAADAAYAAYAAADAAYAAYAAADAAYAAYAADAKRSEILQKCADEVRRIVNLQDLGY